MAEFSPQSKYFNKYEKVRKINTTVFFIMYVLTLVFTFIKLDKVSVAISVLGLVLILVLDLIEGRIKRQADDIKILDFFDNSYGTRFSELSSKEYYDNDDIDYGDTKCAINLFENTLFSMRISEKMLENETKKNLLFGLIILGFAIYGFANSSFSLPLLQIYLSSHFLVKVIRVNDFNKGSKEVFNSMKDIVASLSKGKNVNHNRVLLMKELIKYNIIVAELNGKTSSRIFNEINEELTKTWIRIREKYTEGSI